MMLAGCATSQGSPGLKVPDDCERNAQPVPYPPLSHEDIGVIAARYAAKLHLANGRLIAVKTCYAKVRAVLAGAKMAGASTP